MDRDETKQPEPGTPRARIKLWRRSPRSRPAWSIEVSEGVTAEELGRLIALAFDADRRLAAEAAQPEQGAGA